MQRPSLPFIKVGGTFLLSKRLALSSLMDYFFPVFLMVFPASFILGGGLPVLDRIAIKSPQVAGRRVGDIHLANIVGSIFGSSLISFWMLPTLGSERTYTTLALLALTFPILYFTGKFKSTGSLHLDPRLFPL